MESKATTYPHEQKPRPKPEVIIWEFLGNRPALEGLQQGNPTIITRARKAMRGHSEKNSTAAAKILLEIGLDEQVDPNVAEGAITLLKNIPPNRVHPKLQPDIEIFSTEDIDPEEFQKQVKNIKRKIKISRANRGRRLTPEQEAKRVQTRKGKKGKLHSGETKAKISQSLTGRTLTSEHTTNMSKANKGKKLSDETRKKLSDARKGKPKSEEHKKRISESMKRKKAQE